MDYLEYLNQKLQKNYTPEELAKLAEQTSSDTYLNSAFGNNSDAGRSGGASIFSETNSDDLGKINYESLSKTLNGLSNEEEISSLETALKEFLSIDGIKQDVDKDGNGTITAEEIELYVKELAAKDGNASTLAASDFDTVIRSKNINLGSLLGTTGTATVQDSAPTENNSETQGQLVENDSIENILLELLNPTEEPVTPTKPEQPETPTQPEQPTQTKPEEDAKNTPSETSTPAETKTETPAPAITQTPPETKAETPAPSQTQIPAQGAENPPAQNNTGSTPIASADNTGAAQTQINAPASTVIETPTVVSTGGGGGGGTVSYYHYTGESSASLEAKKTKKEEELKQNQKTLEDAKAGKTEPIKKATTAKNKAEKDYKQAVKNDKKLSDELKKQIKENIEAINKHEEDIKDTKEKIEKSTEKIEEYKTSITDKEGEITSQEGVISQKQDLIDAQEKAILALGKPTGKEEDKEADKALANKIADMNKTIREYKSELKKEEEKKTKLEKEKTELEGKLKKEEENKTKLDDKATKLDEELTKLKEEKEKLDKEVEEKADKETKEKLKTYNEAVATLEKTKKSEVEKAQAAVTKTENEIKSLTTQIETAKEGEEREKREAAAASQVSAGGSYGGGGGGSTVVGGGSGTDQGVTVNTSAASGSSTGNSLNYTAASQGIRRQAEKAGCFHQKGTYTPKRGDIAIWTNIGDPSHGHVGIVQQVNADGSFYVIEGNSGNAVKRNYYSSVTCGAIGARFAGFCDASKWLGEAKAENAIRVAELELSRGVRETSKNDSVDIRRYKRGAINTNEWCAYFTSYCFTDGQSQLT